MHCTFYSQFNYIFEVAILLTPVAVRNTECIIVYNIHGSLLLNEIIIIIIIIIIT